MGRSAPVGRPDILYYGVVFNPTGYGNEARRFVEFLSGQGYTLKLVPHLEGDDQHGILTPGERGRFRHLMGTRIQPNRTVEIHHVPPIMFDTRQRVRRRVARTMCETIGLPPRWAELCNHMDRVWVPSRFNLETFADAGVQREKLRVVPDGVDTQRFRPGLDPLPIAGRRGFNFLSVFDWNRRKGWDVLLRAFLTEFQPDEDVALILKVSVYSAPGNDIRAQMRAFITDDLRLDPAHLPPVLLVDGFMPDCEVPRLYTAADAFVLPSRGEGWGFPYCEAMATGLPTIGTGWGGNRMFMNSENAYLIGIEAIGPIHGNDHPMYGTGQQWAQPSTDHLRFLLRHVFTHRDEARNKGAQARQDMVDHWQWEHAYTSLETALTEVC